MGCDGADSIRPAYPADLQAPIAISDLTCPLYIPHRGGANIAPENTVEALRGAVELGFKLVEVDCSRLRDGGLMVMHDATADRTSNLHGAPDELLTAAVLRGRISAGAWFAASWPSDLIIPALSDVVREVGNHICLLIEAKNAGSGSAAVELVRRSRLSRSVIIQSFLREELDAAIRAGIAAGLVHSTGDVALKQLVDDGIDYLAMYAGAPEENIAAAIQSGLKVFAYGVNRRHQHDRLRQMGVCGFITDDPMYLSRRLPPFSRDPYISQTYWHGCLPSLCGDRGQFTPPDWWGYALGPSGAAPTGYRGALQGWACPSAGERAAPEFTIDTDVVIDGVFAEDRTRWASVFFCAADDHPFADQPYDRAPNGYNAVLRANGELALFRVDAGKGLLLAAKPTPPLGLGATVAHIQVGVTPQAVTLARTDTDQSERIVIPDSTHRGGYIHLGCDGAAARFRHVKVTW